MTPTVGTIHDGGTVAAFTMYGGKWDAAHRRIARDRARGYFKRELTPAQWGSARMVARLTRELVNGASPAVLFRMVVRDA